MRNGCIISLIIVLFSGPLWGDFIEREVEEKVTDSRKDKASAIKAQLWASLNYEPALRAELEMPPLHFYNISGNIKKHSAD